MPANTLFHDIYHELLDQLLDRRLRPGELLNRRDTAERLGVSIAPVREAFQRLEQEGFLVSRPRVGTVVRSIDPEDVRGRIVVREALESHAARLYGGAPVRRQRRTLERLARRVDRRHPSTSAQWQAEVEFHCALVALANCDALLQLFRQVMQQNLFFVINEVFPAVAPDDDSNNYRRNHVLLVDALTTDDPQAAAHIAYQHAHWRLACAARDPNSPFYDPQARLEGTVHD